MSKFRLEKIDETFHREVKELALKNGIISGYTPSVRRITKAIRKHSIWSKLKEDIANTPLKDDRWKNE